MTGLQALSAPFPLTADSDAALRGPRAADPAYAPVRSPVHQLQDQLHKQHAADFGTDGSALDAFVQRADFGQRADKAPGWMRLALPLLLTLVLWALIFWIMGTVR